MLRNVTWPDLVAYAGNVEQALLMRDALDTIGRALVLGDAGRRPSGRRDGRRNQRQGSQCAPNRTTQRCSESGSQIAPLLRLRPEE
ncbi:hypothetical protein CBM2589_A10149 [Cupriavidus taiwanensis]|uniref:Uncharacterized protein n=1 Tax=Cupriavidus taiwanensis TaxID=164546 RepID=A0A375BYH3_9BURK|nr:hypothetical protein CBM2589_A10149 [Cupriavidus taiwanensis]